jgi:hypothetical protein
MRSSCDCAEESEKTKDMGRASIISLASNIWFPAQSRGDGTKNCKPISVMGSDFSLLMLVA